MKSSYFKVGSNTVELRVTADRFGSFRLRVYNLLWSFIQWGELADGMEYCPLAAVFVLLK